MAGFGERLTNFVFELEQEEATSEDSDSVSSATLGNPIQEISANLKSLQSHANRFQTTVKQCKCARGVEKKYDILPATSLNLSELPISILNNFITKCPQCKKQRYEIVSCPDFLFVQLMYPITVPVDQNGMEKIMEGTKILIKNFYYLPICTVYSCGSSYKIGIKRNLEWKQIDKNLSEKKKNYTFHLIVYKKANFNDFFIFEGIKSSLQTICQFLKPLITLLPPSQLPKKVNSLTFLLHSVVMGVKPIDNNVLFGMFLRTIITKMGNLLQVVDITEKIIKILLEQLQNEGSEICNYFQIHIKLCECAGNTVKQYNILPTLNSSNFCEMIENLAQQMNQNCINCTKKRYEVIKSPKILILQAVGGCRISSSQVEFAEVIDLDFDMYFFSKVFYTCNKTHKNQILHLNNTFLGSLNGVVKFILLTGLETDEKINWLKKLVEIEKLQLEIDELKKVSENNALQFDRFVDEPRWNVNSWGCELTGTLIEFEVLSNLSSNLKEIRSTENVQLRIQNHPFAKGSLRYAFHCKLQISSSEYEALVGKLQIYSSYSKSEADRTIDDVKTILIAQYYSNIYNNFNPDKRIVYSSIKLLRLNTLWNNRQFIILEEKLNGKWVKFNNNSTYVNLKDKAQTAQAFSHFTFDHSNGNALLTDIQGVRTMFGYKFTDPAIHTPSGKSGSNLGLDGINDFFKNHKCNSICVALGLKKSPLQDDDEDVSGTKLIL